MASLHSLVPAQRDGSVLDLPVAALAALSVAFATYAMPGDLFSALVLKSGIPSLLPAAEPPLGMKARLAVLGMGTALTFLAVWWLMRALERVPTPAFLTRGKSEAVIEAPPRLRRADSHPDAPAPRPIRAGRDFGEPGVEPLDLGFLNDEAVEGETSQEEDFDAEPWPFETEQPQEVAAATDEPTAAEPDSFRFPFTGDTPFANDEEPVAEDAEPEEEEPFELESHYREPQFMRTADPFLGEAEEAEEEEEEEADPTAEQDYASIGSLSSRLGTASDRSDHSVTDLVGKLEGGLSRREARSVQEAVETPEDMPAQAVGHRLRSAINGLNRAKGG